MLKMVYIMSVKIKFKDELSLKISNIYKRQAAFVENNVVNIQLYKNTTC